MATAIGPGEMFGVKNADESGEGPFYRQVQDSANRGAPYVITPRSDGLFQQILPGDISYKATWSNIQTWLDFDPDADIASQLIYIRLNENQYNNDDVPSYMPNYAILDNDGNVVRPRKWSEWRGQNSFHWKSQSTSVYAVPSTSWGFHINCRVLEGLAGEPYTLYTQKQWDNLIEGLPPDDVIAWPQT